MANIKQQKKRIKTDEAKKVRNKSFVSKINTIYKKTVKALKEKKEDARNKVILITKLLDQAASKNIKHRNYVNRKKSQLHKLMFKTIGGRSVLKKTSDKKTTITTAVKTTNKTKVKPKQPAKVSKTKTE